MFYLDVRDGRVWRMADDDDGERKVNEVGYVRAAESFREFLDEISVW